MILTETAAEMKEDLPLVVKEACRTEDEGCGEVEENLELCRNCFYGPSIINKTTK